MISCPFIFSKGTVFIEGREYEMNDVDFPTVNPEDPYALSREEMEVMKRLISVPGRHPDHIADTGAVPACSPHPHHVMVAPLHIDGMVFA